MAWKIQIKKDTTLPKVGTVIATWTDELKGENFSYTGERINRTVAGANAFVADAKDALLVYQTTTNANRSDEVLLENLLNT